MKKGLSILLIAAALFGFYGGAVNLNDVLACKDYWEEAGEKSTADMNKLEDGLNQLKDNEQAYLDGKDQLAQGEKDLAQGEADYAAGQATLAQGEADYAAAPAKLADAAQQIAKGEKDLAAGETKLANGYKEYNKGKQDLAAGKQAVADGEKALAAGRAQYAAGLKNYQEAPAKLDAGRQAIGGLDLLINGLTNAKNGFEQQWQPNFEKKATSPDGSGAGLEQGRQIIQSQFNNEDNIKSVALVQTLTETSGLLDNINDKAVYADFDTGIQNIITAFGSAAKILKSYADLANSYAGDEGDGALLSQAAACLNQMGDDSLASMDAKLKALNKEVEEAKKVLEDEEATEEDKANAQETITNDAPKIKAIMTLQGTRETVASKLTDLDTDEFKEQLKLVESLEGGDQLSAGIRGCLNALEENSDSEQTPTNKDYADKITTLKTLLGTLGTALEGKVSEISEKAPLLQSWHEGYEALKEGQESIAAVKTAFSTMLTNSTIRKVLNTNNEAKALIPGLTLYSTSRLADDDMDDFDKDMTVVCNKLIPGALKVLREIKKEAASQLAAGEAEYADAPAKLKDAKDQLDAGEVSLAAGKAAVADGTNKLAAAAKQLAQGEKDLAAGKAKLADGKRQYAQGLADYAAAPAKLEAGRQALAEGLEKLEDGRAQLAEGRAKLAEYEDGEQQVRDGLATLMSTEPDGGLTSILDRRNGDADFDNGDNHLELDEGLKAVEVGRGYQADSGVLITKEITNRAIGTAAGLGAGALAVLAAILSFLKKNKGAGVSALLAAAAGGVGTAMGTSAGMEFSSIAGSVVGATPWVAFGILAGVALVHAIAHFAGNKAA